MNQEIENRLTEVRRLIKECEEIADKGNIAFSILIGETYIPEKLRQEDEEYYGYGEDYGDMNGNWWMPSRFC